MASSLIKLPLAARLARQYRERLTPRGQYLFCATILLGLLALDTRRTLILWLFSMAAGMLVAAFLFVWIGRPRARLDFHFPARVTAQRTVGLSARVVSEGAPLSDLRLIFRRSRPNDPEQGTGEIVFQPKAVFLECNAGEDPTLAYGKTQLAVNRRGPRLKPLRS